MSWKVTFFPFLHIYDDRQPPTNLLRSKFLLYTSGAALEQFPIAPQLPHHPFFSNSLRQLTGSDQPLSTLLAKMPSDTLSYSQSLPGLLKPTSAFPSSKSRPPPNPNAHGKTFTAAPEGYNQAPRFSTMHRDSNSSNGLFLGSPFSMTQAGPGSYPGIDKRYGSVVVIQGLLGREGS